MRRRRYRGRHRKDRTLPLGTVVIAASAAAGVYLTAAPGGASAADTAVFVSTTGSDAATGTRATPYRTLARALSAAEPGTTIWVRGGVYHPAAPLRGEIDGSVDHRIELRAYGSESVTVDGSKLAAGDALLTLRADFWTVSGIEFRNSPGSAVVCVSCTGEILEKLTTRAGGGTGVLLRGAGTRGNVIRDVDSHGNHGRPGAPVADGIALISGSGGGNLITGARSYDNSGDGIRLRDWPSPVVVEHSWAVRNGGIDARLGARTVSRGNAWGIPSSLASKGS